MNQKVTLLIRECLQYPEQILARKAVYTPRPLEAALFLTQRCNSRCAMCSFWKNPVTADELTTEQILTLLAIFRKLGVVVLSLSAEGEITLRKDLDEILQKAHKNKFIYSINSNFLAITETMIQSFLKYQPYQITVGIDTLHAEKYAIIRGVENGLSRVLSNIKKVQESGFDNIALGTVVLHNNLDDIPELVNYVINNSLMGIRFTAFQPFGFGKRWSDEELSLYTNDKYQEKLHQVIATLIAMKKKGAPIINSIPYLNAIPESYKNPSFFPVVCRIPNRRIHVYSNGDVSLCQVMEKDAIIGNIHDASVKEIWYSGKARQIRDIVGKKKCGGCWLSCYQETNLRFSKKNGLAVLANSTKRFCKL